MYLKRSLEDPVIRASGQFSVILLTGPRQVGKTTLLKYICEKGRNYVSLDDLSLRALANDDPKLFLQRFKTPLIIDEIQYAPNLLPYIKIKVDQENKPGQFWLTGSQHFHMMKGITESLAGRVAIINLLGFSRREKYQNHIISPAFIPSEDTIEKWNHNPEITDINSILKDIWLGFYPAVVTQKVIDHDLYYSSYVQTYIERDIKDLAQVGDERVFLKFLKSCAARTAQLLNLNDLARDVDISIPTAKRWLSILEASYQIYILPPYYSNVTKRLIKTPKMYFLDTGLCSYLTNWTTPDTLSTGSMRGAIFETYVFSEILKSWWHRLKNPNIYYYRDKDKKEIDFIIEQDQILYPIEVKLGATPKKDWARNFPTLKRLNKKVAPGIVISLTDTTLPINNESKTINVALI